MSWKINGDSHLNYEIKQMGETKARVADRPKRKRNIRLESNHLKTEEPPPTPHPPPPRTV